MSLSKVTKTSMMDIRVRCIGIMKRDKKVKLHNLDIVVDIPYQDIDLEEYIGRAKIIVKSRMKTLEKCELYLSPWTKVDEEGYAHSMKEVRFADPRYKSIILEDAWRSV